MNLDFIAGTKDIVKTQATEEKVHYQCQACRAGLRRPGILGKTAGRPDKIFLQHNVKKARGGDFRGSVRCFPFARLPLPENFGTGFAIKLFDRQCALIQFFGDFTIYGCIIKPGISSVFFSIGKIYFPALWTATFTGSFSTSES